MLHEGVTSRVLHPSAVPSLLAEVDTVGFARAAVFDADGTLWAGDIGDAAFVQSARAGLVSDAMYEGPLAAWASRTGLSLPTDKVEGIANEVRRRAVPVAAWKGGQEFQQKVQPRAAILRRRLVEPLFPRQRLRAAQV